jgi:hypothetical protein
MHCAVTQSLFRNRANSANPDKTRRNMKKIIISKYYTAKTAIRNEQGQLDVTTIYMFQKRKCQQSQKCGQSQYATIGETCRQAVTFL